jgi:drug/metabolite transporter (DMT)-like permease
MKSNKYLYAVFLAVCSAVFYAFSAPLSKILLAHTGPAMLAALLYLGAGAGMGILFGFSKGRKQTGEKLGRKDMPYTAAMVCLDIAAPILLMNGVRLTAAAEVSVLSNFEIAATALIAFLVFREKISGRMWVSLALITAASVILSYEGSARLSFSAGAAFVIAACICWGLENNCTKMLSSKNTYEIIVIKGIFSGAGSLIIAFIAGESFPGAKTALCASVLGFFAYGLSLFAYIKAQSVLGAAKTSAFYALSPFIGALLSFLILNESLSPKFAAGLAVMTAGSALAVRDTLKKGDNNG